MLYVKFLVALIFLKRKCWREKYLTLKFCKIKNTERILDPIHSLTSAPSPALSLSSEGLGSVKGVKRAEHPMNLSVLFQTVASAQLT